MPNYSHLPQSLNHLPHPTNEQLYIDNQDQLKKFTQDQNHIKKVRYPTPAIKPIIPIDTWLNRTSELKLRKNMETTLKTQGHFKYLREIRGDGNCFIRAIAFYYLTQLKSTSIQTCFPYLKDIQLTSSSPQFIPKNFLPYYNSDFLSYCLNQSWQKSYNKHLLQQQGIYKLALSTLMIENPYLDFIIVLYFRAVSLLALKRLNKVQQIQNFLLFNDEQKLKNYGSHSDGLTHFLISKFLGIGINIYEIRNEQVICYEYKTTKPNKGPLQNFVVNVVLHNKHYDLLESQIDITGQMTNPTLQKYQSYYSNQNQAMTQGICISCESKIPIFLSNNLCQECFTRNKSALDEFKKKKPIDLSSQDQKQNPQSSGKSKLVKKVKQQSSLEKKQKRAKKKGICGCFG